ncbi:hypothetical protein A1O1_07424 [Capronia coronata CBS 617.96]|uniref:SUZ domain-containing protein n=1 Tax=Capronia coronata CBS 617.96 TaxID=1182541 RepID=W9XTB6_9EURO|nr:uncharacterized protein A1O1_07424 [Capronia coronata CBS 617.96]EXJ83797.1 hypothetical protein A1O1_07424 [Capronia coronata CBS 617.96]
MPSRGPQSAESGESLEDDQSHLSTSSTKQQSFDTKSMASVTTFAMDEKESIRPDDSASVRAADDDETPNAASRESSLHRDSEPLVSGQQPALRPNASGVTIAARRYQTLTLTNTPRFGDLPVAPLVQEQNAQQAGSGSSIMQPDSDERVSALPVAPDEKLLDALASPKDRLPLLQLEEKFIGFIANPESDFLDLPPQNSFARLLSHKLADYYSLAHHINDDGTSIRLFRTPCASLPTPLHVLAQSIPASQAQAPAATGVKIMRRGGLALRQGSAGGSTPASSSVPSKATSEAGLDIGVEEGLMFPADGTPNKDKSKLTREEREAQYKAARERIFGDFQESVTSESASTGENSASMSRSSSSSGKRKSRKHKTPKDDSFEARSAFIPSYAPLHMQHMPAHYQPQYAEQAYQAPYQSPPNGYGTGYNYGTTPTQSYPSFEPSMPYNSNNLGYMASNSQQFAPSDSWSSMQTPSSAECFNYSASSTGYQQNISPMMNQATGQFMSPTYPGMQQPQNWMNTQFQPPYQQPSAPTGSSMNSWSGFPSTTPLGNTTSHAHGQLSGQQYSGNPAYNAQQPVPGSYSRSLFNPQTRSFIPSNAMSRVGGRNGRKKPSASSAQIRTNSTSRPPAAAEPSGVAMFPPPRRFDQGSITLSSANLQSDSLQQKYGAPAHLPKKPPPSQVPTSYDVDGINNTASSTGSGSVNEGPGPGSGGLSGGSPA